MLSGLLVVHGSAILRLTLTRVGDRRHALKLGKLFDQIGSEVTLRKFGGAEAWARRQARRQSRPPRSVFSR